LDGKKQIHTFINHSKNTKDLNLLHLTHSGHRLSDFAKIKGILITKGVCFRVFEVRVLTGLVQWKSKVKLVFSEGNYLRECAIVPHITFRPRWRSLNKPQFACFDILLNGVEFFLFAYFKLRPGVSGDFNHSVENSFLGIDNKRNIVEGRNASSVFVL